MGSDSNGGQLALRELPRLSATISSLLLRSGRDVMSGWDGLIERSMGGIGTVQGIMHTLNSYCEPN